VPVLAKLLFLTVNRNSSLQGYSIEDLAKGHFLEVSYLVIFGELPTVAQLENFETNIRKYTLVNEK
jgi:citrate synthase